MLIRQRDGTYKSLFGNIFGAGKAGGASSETAETPMPISHDVEESSIPEDPQGEGYGSRTYRRRRRRERAGDYWDSRRNRDRAWERQPAPEDDLRIPQPDINDPNQTPDGGINY